ncbi:MAG: hypothetical protein CL677_01395 [Bdellovibrionaceae bacterium]|nr:hypothetical protein [Pseudobdellovibrionaceae bacterium]
MTTLEVIFCFTYILFILSWPTILDHKQKRGSVIRRWIQQFVWALGLQHGYQVFAKKHPVADRELEIIVKIRDREGSVSEMPLRSFFGPAKDDQMLVSKLYVKLLLNSEKFDACIRWLLNQDLGEWSEVNVRVEQNIIRYVSPGVWKKKKLEKEYYSFSSDAKGLS